MKANKMIRKAMRKNEVSLLAYLRRERVTYISLWSIAWHNALDRLEKAGRVKFHNGVYVVRKGAGPVTPAVRGSSSNV